MPDPGSADSSIKRKSYEPKITKESLRRSNSIEDSTANKDQAKDGAHLSPGWKKVDGHGG